MPVEASAKPFDDLQDGPSVPGTGLVLVSTPIGNIGDISARARATLASCDLVLCEDSRRSARLFATIGSHVRLETLHEYNEDSRIPGIITRLKTGQTIALISDAGTPLVSDPGYRLVRAVISEGLPVTAVPGPSAAMTALILSGLPPQPFLFLGFPNARQMARRAGFSNVRAAERAGLSATMIWLEAPHRLLETLSDLEDIFGNRSAAVARELTKRFETVERGKLCDIRQIFMKEPPRGEITIIVGPAESDDPENLDATLRTTLLTESVKDAAEIVSQATGLPRRIVYAHALRLMKER